MRERRFPKRNWEAGKAKYTQERIFEKESPQVSTCLYITSIYNVTLQLIPSRDKESGLVLWLGLTNKLKQKWRQPWGFSLRNFAGKMRPGTEPSQSTCPSWRLRQWENPAKTHKATKLGGLAEPGSDQQNRQPTHRCRNKNNFFFFFFVYSWGFLWFCYSITVATDNGYTLYLPDLSHITILRAERGIPPVLTHLHNPKYAVATFILSCNHLL